MNSNITQKTLDDLEYQEVLKSISEYCISDLGRDSIFELMPKKSNDKILYELHLTNEYLNSFINENRIPSHYFDDISKEIHLLNIEDSFLEAKAFQRISNHATTVNELILFFKKFKEYYPTHFNLIDVIEFTKAINSAIDEIITPYGEVKNEASDALKHIRKEIHINRGKIGSSFTKVLSHYSSSEYLDDIKESVVDNQRVLAVKAMHRKKIKGSILGSSKTGSIVFIAPEATLKLNRELQNLQYDEQEEIVKILKELSNKIRPYTPLLNEYQAYLTKLDIVAAKAKYSRSIHACLPIISKKPKIYLREAYHPILWKSNKERDIKTIPQTLTLDENQRIIVISGPNAGGKSITLKTIGLLQVMLQSGILIPVHEKSEISFFKTILTDIGDNQSIENHLSTYSYRLKNMRNFLRKCNNNTLFLIDEFGTGSDPELGGALAEVFLEEFYEKGAYGIITTHYANLKVLADELDEALNANMQFDQFSLEPLFKLNIGQAGSSFTFEVAQKNGIPFRLINRAKKKVEREKIRLDKTIAKLQKERNKLQKTLNNLESEKDKAKESSTKLAESREKIKDKINSFQELYDNNQKMLSYGRKINEIINKYFQKNNKKELIAEFLKWVAIEQSKNKKTMEIKTKEKIKREILEKPLSNRERKKINQQKRIEEEKKQKLLKQVEKELMVEVSKVRKEKEIYNKTIDQQKAAYQFKVNDKVRLIDGNSKGTIEKIEKNIATINYGIFTAKSNINQLELVQSAKK